MKFEDLTGQTFGRLTVLERAPNKGKHTMWLCECQCGNQKAVAASKLKSGNTVSCGCHRADSLGNAMRTHGLTNTRLYRIWCHMKGRCNNVTDRAYAQYGGRGIQVCAAWQHDFLSFYTWAMHNGYEDHLSIDRIDNDGNYDPMNCRWIPLEENSRKQKTDEHMKRHGFYHGRSPDGIVYDFTDAEKFGAEHMLSGKAIRSSIYRNQIYKGWSFWTDK